jgi:hypothetical protein
MRTVTVEARGVYGRELFYPIDETAERIVALIGRRSLTRLQLQAVKDLGFEIVIKTPSLEGLTS